MRDLVHMFAVIEGSRGDNDEPAACSMNQKVSAGEAIWRPDGGVEACGNSVIPRMQTYYGDPGDVTLPIKKYDYHLYTKTNRCSGILLS